MQKDINTNEREEGILSVDGALNKDDTTNQSMGISSGDSLSTLHFYWL